jgi:hypothetical protein
MLNLLEEVISYKKNLLGDSFWKREVLLDSPPVLWFGNHKQDKIIVTVGANPSRKEFLDERDGKPLVGSRKRLSYPDSGDVDTEEQKVSLLQSYDSYFQRNPYCSWFGRPGGYHVEGFANGLNASFYGGKNRGAVHIDLVPFATRSDFSALEEGKVIGGFFSDRWAQTNFTELVGYLKPELMVIFGRTNVETYNRRFGASISLSRTFKVEGKPKAKYGISQFRLPEKQIPFVGLSTNLGNPIGFTIKTLNQFGRHILSELSRAGSIGGD